MAIKKSFVEIGSCDFETNIDLITSGHWLGIMCEPATKYRENLEKYIKKNPHSKANLFTLDT